MDDTYLWGETPEYDQAVLSELENGFLSSQVISNSGPVTPDGHDAIMTILGAPVNMNRAIALLVAELQGRVRRAFPANKVLCSRAPLKERLQLHQTPVWGAALWGCPAWPTLS